MFKQRLKIKTLCVRHQKKTKKGKLEERRRKQKFGDRATMEWCVLYTEIQKFCCIARIVSLVILNFFLENKSIMDWD